MANAGYFVYARDIESEKKTLFSFVSPEIHLVNFEEIARDQGCRNYFTNIESLLRGIKEYEDVMTDSVYLDELDFYSECEDYVYYDETLKSEIHYRSLSDKEMKELRETVDYSRASDF